MTAPADQGGLGAFYLIDGTTRAIVGRGVGNGGTFGWSVCFADLYPFLPDGVPEVLVGAPTRGFGTSLQVGEVTIFEVKNFIVRTVGTSTGSAAFDRYGECIASNGNLGPNPGEDVVITARGGPSSLTPCSGGYFVVRDSISTTRVNGPPRVCFGSSILIDDVDGDNAKEIVIGCGFTGLSSTTFVYDYDQPRRTWLWSRRIDPSPPVPAFGVDVIRVPDRNQDGFDDLAIAGTSDVQIWAGRTFQALDTLRLNAGSSRTQLAFLGDLDRDGTFEFGATVALDGPSSALQIRSKTKQPFTPDENYVDALRGATIWLDIDVGPKHAGQVYLILGTLSGLGPSYRLGNASGTFDLVPDPLTTLLPQIVNHGPFVQWLGVLDGNGRPSSRPRWISGNIATFAPLAMHMQVLVLENAKPEFRLVTHARHLLIR